MSRDALSLLSLQYGLSMLVGRSLELDEMLGRFMPAALKILACRSGHIWLASASRARAADIMTPVYGYPAPEAKRLLTDPNLPSEIARALEQTRAAEKAHSARMIPAGDGRGIFYVLSIGSLGVMVLQRMGAPLPEDVVGALRPILERLELACQVCLEHEGIREREADLRLATEMRFSSLFRNLADAAAILAMEHNGGGLVTDYRFLDVNPAFEEVSGRAASDLVGKAASDVFGSGPPFLKNLALAVRTGSARNLELEFFGGRNYRISAFAPEPNRVVTIFHDVTDLKESREQVSFLAHHDALTGLPNRLLLHDRLKMLTAHCQRVGCKAALLFIDLDNFKDVNDSLGHLAGDAMLVEVARRFSSVVRCEDTIARLGGDEFIIALGDLDSEKGVLPTLRRLFESLARPVRVAGQEVWVTPSIGVTFYPDDGDDPETLIKNADIAMYRAKEEGRNRYRLYTSRMNERVGERLRLEAAMRHALERDEFILHYQPKVNALTGRVVGVEALARWVREDGSLVPPASFIPLAEESGIIVPLGEMLLEKACRDAVSWAAKGLGDMRVAVNISLRQCREKHLPQRVEQILLETGLPASRLELEVTETTLAKDLDIVMPAIETMAGLGITISIDDFGTGYSSLSYLKRFPISALKIDRSFIRDLPEDEHSAAIIAAIIGIARAMKIEVVAEGVETEAQLEALGRAGCHLIQGYYFSRPLPTHETELYLSRHRR